jgi:exopolysaccharide production protein ExoQ
MGSADRARFLLREDFMNPKTNHQASELLLLFGALFLSSFSAFFSVIWLNRQVVFVGFLLWFLLTLLSVWLLIRNNYLSVFIKNIHNNWIVLPFFIFSGLSIFWSIAWEISLYRWLILCSTIMIGGYIGLRYSIQDMIEFLSGFGLLILVLSALLIVFFPFVGVMNYYDIQGAWKGLYWHKNHMGLMATFINILFLFNLINSFHSNKKQLLAWSLPYIFSLLFIFKSDSVAAYITTLFLHGAIMLALVWLKFRKKIHSSHYLILVMILMVVSIILLTNLDQFFGFFNRNTTLTGRIPMWTYLFDTYFSKRPFWGYGFNAFWYLPSHRVAMQQAAGYPDPIVIADNGFIDILVNTGFIGLILFLIFYFGVWWHSIKNARKAEDVIGFFPLVIMFYTLFANISWSLIYENESFFMLIMIMVLFCVSKKEQGKIAKETQSIG